MKGGPVNEEVGKVTSNVGALCSPRSLEVLPTIKKAMEISSAASLPVSFLVVAMLP